MHLISEQSGQQEAQTVPEDLSSPQDRGFGSQEEDEGEAPALVRRKKKSILEKLGHLRCEVCGFDFQKAYGELGEGFIECQFKRYEVSIPCTITHEGEPIRGRITDISMGGVLITELTGPPPPEKAFITVNFQVDQMALTQRNVAIHPQGCDN